LGGVSTGHSAGSGMESQMGGAMIGPDAYGGSGVAPIGGYSPAYQEMMQQRQHQAQLKEFLNPMLQQYGIDRVKSLLDGYIQGFDLDKYAAQQEKTSFTTPLKNTPPLDVVETTPSVYGATYDFSQPTKSVPITGVPLANRFIGYNPQQNLGIPGPSGRSRGRGLIGRGQMMR
jgi:hypothetical protein